jgi:hypothetical protein
MFHHCADVVLAGPVTPGVTVAHTLLLYWRNGHHASLYWPGCLPTHEHPCSNDSKGLCASKCQCRCDCDLPQHHVMSAPRAMTLGAVACTSPACTKAQHGR